MVTGRLRLLRLWQGGGWAIAEVMVEVESISPMTILREDSGATTC
jgi:hypothetical protein